MQPQSSANGLEVMPSQSSANGLQLPVGFREHSPPWHQQKMYPPKKAQCVCASAPLHLCTNFGGTAHIKVFFFRELAICQASGDTVTDRMCALLLF